MVTLLFTTSNLFFSKLTRWGLGTDCSHFAIGFGIDRPGGIIFHSNLVGVNIDFYSNFKIKNKVIHEITFYHSTQVEQEELFNDLIKNHYKKGYDFGAYLFWAVSLIGYKLFGIKMSKNLWQSKDKFLCTEIYESLGGKKIGSFRFPYIKSNVLSPHEIYDLITRWMQCSTLSS